jgi:predicted MFS family arabinose efflux permease
MGARDLTVGVLVSLVAAGLADRFGRRRTLLMCVAGAAIANAVTAVAPSFNVFTVRSCSRARS